MDIRPIQDGEESTVADLWNACGLVRPWNDPVADIALARHTQTSEILVGLNGDAIVATAMTGFDGHRGWVYYVAVDPSMQGTGAGKKIMTAAEDYLRQQGCPKVELIVRSSNKPVADFYKAIGYHPEDRLLLAKWLREPPVAQDEVPILDITVTFLAMESAPTTSRRRPPSTGTPLTLQRLQEPTTGFYRYIQHTVGDPWLWYERRKMDDDTLRQIIHDERVEIYVLSEGGVPAGFIELDFREMPNTADVAYFGLFPDFIGRGFGPYLLDWGIHTAWDRSPAPKRLTVNTCTLDHPTALGMYQRFGFVPYDRKEAKVPDPRALGLIPAA